jgi:predicted RecB family nuclease
VRKPGPNGAFVYEPEDAKLARKAKVEHILQLGIYAELLASTAGMPVRRGTLHVAGGAPQSVDLGRTRYILQRLMRRFEAFCVADTRATRATPCAACAQCDYKPRCEAEWRAADSPFFVAAVSGAKVVKLEESGIKTLADLAGLKPNAKIARMGADTLAKLAAQARLQLQARTDGKPHLEILPPASGRGFYLLPAPDPCDLFFDLEGDALYERERRRRHRLEGWGPRLSTLTVTPTVGYCRIRAKAANIGVWHRKNASILAALELCSTGRPSSASSPR